MKSFVFIFCSVIYYVLLYLFIQFLMRAFQIKRKMIPYGILYGIGIFPLFCLIDYFFRGNPYFAFMAGIGYILLGFLLYYVLVLLILILIQKCISLIRKKKSSIFRKSTVFIASGCSIVICIIGIICAQVPEYKEYNLDINLKNHMRITVVSDIHYGATGSMLSLDRMVENINKTNADVVLLVGDVFDNKIKNLNHDYFVNTMNQIKSNYGVYAITGNHEFMTNDLAQIKAFYEGSQIHLLLDEEVIIDNTFRLLGRIDYRGGRKEVKDVISTSKLPLIVLDHQPQFYREAQEYADLQISGHTHNGQIFPGDWLISLLNQMAYQSPSDGLHRYDNFILSITRGYGTWGFPMRLTGPSQIIVYNL